MSAPDWQCRCFKLPGPPGTRWCDGHPVCSTAGCGRGAREIKYVHKDFRERYLGLCFKCCDAVDEREEQEEVLASGFASAEAMYAAKYANLGELPAPPRTKRPTRIGRAATPAKTGPGVYFIEAEGTGRVKIGKADDPASRMAGLQTGSAHRLRLLAVVSGAEPEERALHERFDALRLHGEWFSLSGELAEHVAELAR